MHRTTARPVRSTLLLAALAATLTLVACASAAAQAPTLATDPGTPTQPAATPPAATDPGTTNTNPGGGTGSQPGQPGDPSGPVTGGPAVNDPIPGDGAAHVEPVAGVKDARPAAIDHISTSPNGLTVTVYWYGGVDTCYALSSATATRDPSGLLVVTVLEGTRPGLPANTACIDIAMLKATTIGIDQPLFRDGSQPVLSPEPR